MNVNIKRESDTTNVVIAKVEGRVDGTNSREFHDTIKSALKPDDETLLLDFEKLEYISSAGLRAIMLLAREAQKQNAKLVTCAPSAAVAEIFTISGFDQLFAVCESQEEALGSPA